MSRKSRDFYYLFPGQGRGERKRYFRNKYDQMPLFVRPFVLFIYRYFFRFGFLDGTEGLIYWVLQIFWFRFLVDAKLWEKRHAARLAGNTAVNSVQQGAGSQRANRP